MCLCMCVCEGERERVRVRERERERITSHTNTLPMCVHGIRTHSANVRNTFCTCTEHTLHIHVCTHTLLQNSTCVCRTLLQRRPMLVTLPYTSERILLICMSHIRTYSVSTHVHTSELILYASEHKMFTHTCTSEIVPHIYVSVIRTYSVSYTRTADVIE